MTDPEADDVPRAPAAGGGFKAIAAIVFVWGVIVTVALIVYFR